MSWSTIKSLTDFSRGECGVLKRCAAVTVRDDIMAHRFNNHGRNTPMLLRLDLPDWVA